ncbi:uncharacterized protein CBL_08217 [Carabus blaptoides fortunei]
MKLHLSGQSANLQNSKQWPQYLAVLTAGISGVALGSHFAWTSPALPIILSDDFPVNITSGEASYIAMIGPMGDFLGAPLAAWFADKIGRKNGILSIALPTLVAWIILAFANSTLVFCIGRFISGIGEGIFFIVYPMYVGEVTESKIRGQGGNPQRSKQWPQYLAVLTGSISSIALGLHYSWTSPALPILLSDDFPVNITSDEASYIAMIGPIGDFFGAPLAAWFADIIGRKNGILLIALPTFVAWMILAFAKSTLEFCIGRFISGIGDGMLFIVYPMYVGEVTEPKIRETKDQL